MHTQVQARTYTHKPTYTYTNTNTQVFNYFSVYLRQVKVTFALSIIVELEGS